MDTYDVSAGINQVVIGVHTRTRVWAASPKLFQVEADVSNCFVKDTHALERASCKGMSGNVSVLAVFRCQNDACYPQASFYHCT